MEHVAIGGMELSLLYRSSLCDLSDLEYIPRFHNMDILVEVPNSESYIDYPQLRVQYKVDDEEFFSFTSVSNWKVSNVDDLIGTINNCTLFLGKMIAPGIRHIMAIAK